MTQPEHNPFGFIGLTYDDVLLLPGPHRRHPVRG